MTNPIILALDTSNFDQACRWAREAQPHIGMIKIGLEFFLKFGGNGVRHMTFYDRPIMLDLKLHDIPNTVAGAMRSILPLRPAFVTVHAFGGADMIAAAREAVDSYAKVDTKLIAVTVLTSLTNEGLHSMGMGYGMKGHVELLADIAINAGADGVVCSPHEVAMMRREFPDTLIVVPGIRPAGSDVNDQTRPSTPQHAMAAGANHLVIGRPITQAVNPGEAAKAILESLT